MTAITLGSRDICRLGSSFVHVVGTNPPREVIIGAGDSKILDVMDGGEAINIIVATPVLEDVVQADGTIIKVPKLPEIKQGWFNPNLPEEDWPTPENIARKAQARDTSGDGTRGDNTQSEDKRRAEQAARRQSSQQEQTQGGVKDPNQGYQIQESNVGGKAPDKAKDKVSLTGANK